MDSDKAPLTKAELDAIQKAVEAMIGKRPEPIVEEVQPEPRPTDGAEDKAARQRLIQYGG